ncbi:MAG: RtcB family protein [Bacteroidaceae bacterium]|nr:RtcB family protein [Bacteroidaceae bacterium]
MFLRLHCAGRVLSRTAAINTLNMAEEIRQLEEKGIIHAIQHQNDMQEATGAYKNIEDVIAQEADLVKVKYRLLSITVING